MKELKDLLNKRVKINYNSSDSEIAREEGVLIGFDNAFLHIKSYNSKDKSIPINKIIRIEEI